MPTPSVVDILRHIAREEPLSSTVRAFRGLTREHLGQLLEEAAGRLTEAAVSSPEPRAGSPAPQPVPAAATPGGGSEPRPRGPRRGS